MRDLMRDLASARHWTIMLYRHDAGSHDMGSACITGHIGWPRAPFRRAIGGLGHVQESRWECICLHNLFERCPVPHERFSRPAQKDNKERLHQESERQGTGWQVGRHQDCARANSWQQPLQASYTIRTKESL